MGVAGCASDDNKEAQIADDPLEPMNRFFFDFNQRLDRHAALPAASFLCQRRAAAAFAAMFIIC